MSETPFARVVTSRAVEPGNMYFVDCAKLCVSDLLGATHLVVVSEDEQEWAAIEELVEAANAGVVLSRRIQRSMDAIARITGVTPT